MVRKTFTYSILLLLFSSSLLTANTLAHDTQGLGEPIYYEETDSSFEIDQKYEDTYEVFEEESTTDNSLGEIGEDGDDVAGPFVGIMGVMFSMFSMFFWGFWVFFICISVISIGGFVFNIVMLVDCLQREFEEKTLWTILLVVGLLFGINIIVSLLYYLLVKKKLD